MLCKVQKMYSKISKIKKGRIITQSKCALCGIKKSRFMKEQETKGLLSNLGIKVPLNKISLLGDTFFYVYII